MANLILNETTKVNAEGKETTLVVLAGTVKKVREGKGEAAGKVRNVVLEGTRYDKAAKKEIPATADVAFWNSDNTEDQLNGRNQNADRIAAAKVREGAFIMVLAAKKSDGSLVGYDFKYNGVIRIAGGQKYTKADGSEAVSKDRNYILGTVTKVTKDDVRGLARVTVVTDGWDKNKEEKATEFHSITIWNRDGNPNASENALMYLAPKKSKDEEGKKVYRRAVFSCGENAHFGKAEDDPDAGNSYTGYRYDFVPAPKKADAQDVQNQEAEAPQAEPDEDGFIDAPEDALPWEE